MKIFVGWKANTYRYLIDDGNGDKKSKRKKKRKLKFENYENSLESTQFENKINHLEKR